MLRIGLAQVNLTVGDIGGNSAKIVRWTEKAHRKEADIVAFPELALSGYPAEDLLLRRRFLEDCRAALRQIAGKTKPPAVIVGFPDRSDAIHNSAAVIGRGKVIAIVNKIHLPNYGVFDEQRYFKPGKKTCVLAAGAARVGISICEDIWYEDVSRAQVASGGAHLIINISCSPYHAGKGVEREELMKERAVAHRAYVAYVNLVGGQDELVFDGHSVIIDPSGRVLARGKQFDEDLIVADIDVKRAQGSARGGIKKRGKSIPVETVKVGIAPRARRKPVGSRMAPAG
jgi:NAD+ synthase (glutamine-hydrolysing)